jgi:hypothetical protein
MRYMGSIGALTQQESAFLAGFQQAYPVLGAEAQAAVFDAAVSSGGAADALLKQRAIFGGVGLALGLAVGVALSRRRR